jgi:VWFA-related protein
MKSVLTLILIALCGIVSAAQDAGKPSDEPIATLKANSRLVLLDVVVTDAKSEPVTNLSADDVKVYEDGRLQKLASFALVNNATIAANAKASPAPELGPGIYYNRRGLESQQGQVTVLLLDRLNTPVGDQFYVRQQILKYLDAHKNDGQPIAIFGLWNSLTLLQDFTTDTALLRQALEKHDVSSSSLLADDFITNLENEALTGAGLSVAPSTGGTGGADQSGWRTVMTARALKVLSEWVAGLPGRKKLIWFSTLFPSGGIPGNSQRTYVGMDESVTMLSENQISVYPVQAGGVAGLGTSVFDAHSTGRNGTDKVMTGRQFGTAISRELAGYNVNNDTMRRLAEQTGGVAYHGNDLADSLGKILSDGTVYYAISYTPEDKTWDQKYRKLEVRTQRRGLQLRYRPGYFAVDPLRAASQSMTAAKRELGTALYSPVVATGLPFYGVAQPITKENPLPALAPKGFQGRKLLPAETAQANVGTHPVDVGFLIQLSELSYEQMKNDLRHCSLELFVGVFMGNKLVGHAEDSMSGNLEQEAFAKMGSAGGVFHTIVHVPDEKVRLRLIVRDNRSGKIGALDIPYPNEVASK